MSKPDLFSEEPEKSIFDSNDLFEDPFGFSSTSESSEKKSTNRLVSEQGEEEEDEENDLFSQSSKPSLKVTKKVEEEENNNNNEDDVSLFEEKPKPPDSVSVSSSRSSLFDDVSASKSRLAFVFDKDKSKDEDLFSETVNESKPREKISLFDECDDGDDLFSETVGKQSQPDDLFTTEHTLPFEKPKPPSSLSLKTSQVKPVGKLNIPDNLKVRLESVAKHISPGVRPPKEEAKVDEDEEESIEKEKIKREVEQKNPTEEIDDEMLGVQPSTLLKCPSKDRVKIPGRRRPQSRRARQEAIRTSGTWDVSPKESQSSPVVSNPLSPSTDEEDFFKVPELDKNFEKEDQSIFKSDLFESKTSKLDENLLFDGAPVLSPLSPQKKPEQTVITTTTTTTTTTSTSIPATTPETESLFGSKPSTLFDDDDDDGDDLGGDDNLFKSTKPILVEEKMKKKSLFDLEDDEEDDLFGGATHVSVSKPSPVFKTKQPTTQAKEKEKEKEKENFVDPLGLMTKD